VQMKFKYWLTANQIPHYELSKEETNKHHDPSGPLASSDI